MIMIPNKKHLVEVCPQCCKLVDSSAYRLVYDTCGHSKCRICLLQEITGCLLCSTSDRSFAEKKMTFKKNLNSDYSSNFDYQKRKSVITSLAIQKAEQKGSENSNSLSFPPAVNDTCHIIKQSLENDILFPTEIVKRSTGNFFHLKRIFSQRFFNESSIKKHKACEAKEKVILNKEGTKKDQHCEIEDIEKKNWKLPSHIQVQYYCTIHKLTLEEKNVLKHHMSCTISGEKTENIYKCEICSKAFKVISKLNRHMKIHTKNSRFKCLKCGKPCTDNYALRNHERTHSNLKPYSCSYCEKKFSGFQNFKRHEKRHKNEKTFVCDDCGYKFITRTELKRHAVTHTNIKSYACQICSMKFAFKRTLTRHAKTHNGNLIKIKCIHCESTFKRKDNLERHIKTAHCDVKVDVHHQNN